MKTKFKPTLFVNKKDKIPFFHYFIYDDTEPFNFKECSEHEYNDPLNEGGRISVFVAEPFDEWCACQWTVDVCGFWAGKFVQFLDKVIEEIENCYSGYTS